MQTKIFVATLLVVALSACMIESNDDDSGALTYFGGDDFLKVAVNYIGANCDKEGVTAPKSHYLDGSDGELILEQAKKNLGRTQWRGFSGDKVMGRTSDESVTTMEAIEAECRRLILSVDVEEGKFPKILMEKGPALQNKKEKFEKDFGGNGYGEVDCLSDTKLSLCTFAKIKGKNGKQRWFTYLEPDNASKTIHGEIVISDDDQTTAVRFPITLKGIYREQLTPELADYLRRNCFEKRDSTGLGVNNVRRTYDDDNSNGSKALHGRTYAASSIYTYRFQGHITCENSLYGLGSPAVVNYLKTCGASCVNKSKDGQHGYERFALRFTKHDLAMECGDDIGFYVENNNGNDRLHWTEDEGNGIARGWYDCHKGGYSIDGAAGGKSEPQSNDRVADR